MQLDPLAQRQEAKVKEEVVKRQLSKNNTINYSKGYIRIQKNQLWFNQLSRPFKHLLINSLRKIERQNQLKEVFFRWRQETQPHTQGKMMVLDDQEASKLIWRMQEILQTKKEKEREQEIKGDLLALKKNYNDHRLSLDSITQRLKDLQQMNLQSKDEGERRMLNQKYEKFKTEIQKKIEEIMQKIKEGQIRLKESRKKQQISYNGPLMDRILTKSILKEVRNLLRDSITAIVEMTRGFVSQSQQEHEEVYVVFEQSYRTKRMKKKSIVRLLGSTAYLEKVNWFNEFMKNRLNQSQAQKSRYSCLASCHRCLKVLKSSQFSFCQTAVSHKQTCSYPSTDYYSYRTANYEGHYFYEPQQAHILPFFMYARNHKHNLTCNRAFCKECLQLFALQKDTNQSCLYCRGFCNCPRCEKGMQIVKLIALDFNNDPEQRKIYHEALRLFGGPHQHRSVSHTLDLRLANSSAQMKLLQRTWMRANKYKIKPKVGLSLQQLQAKMEEPEEGINMNWEIDNILHSFEDDPTFPKFQEEWVKNEEEVQIRQDQFLMQEELSMDFVLPRNIITDDTFEDNQWWLMKFSSTHE